MDNTALAALHVAAQAIGRLPDVIEANADNDHDSGEVIFSLTNGQSYALKLSWADSEVMSLNVPGETK